MRWSEKSRPRLRAGRYPGAGGIGRAAGEPDTAAPMDDEEQGVVAPQEHALDREEIAGDDAAACACKNSRQLGPARRGAGSSLAWASSRRILVGET